MFVFICDYLKEILVVILGLAATKVIADKNRIQNAKDRFRELLLREMHGLYPEPFEWPDDIIDRLNKSKSILQSEIDNLKFIVPAKQLSGLDSVWGKYLDDISGDISYHSELCNRLYGLQHNGKAGDLEEAKRILHENIKALLKFTK